MDRNPCRRPVTTASVRELTWSMENILSRCLFTVRRLRPSSAAISLLLEPRAASFKICSSLADNFSPAGSGAGFLVWTSARAQSHGSAGGVCDPCRRAPVLLDGAAPYRGASGEDGRRHTSNGSGIRQPAGRRQRLSSDFRRSSLARRRPGQF